MNKLIKEQLEKEIKKEDFLKKDPTGFIHLNNSFKNTIIENTKLLEINSYYPTIILNLHKEGLINIKSDIIDDICYFKQYRENIKGTSLYGELKSKVNSCYGKIAKEYKDSHKIYHLIYSYQIIINSKLNSFYTDIDHFHTTGSFDTHILDEEGFDYKIVDYNYFYINKIKSYLYMDYKGNIYLNPIISDKSNILDEFKN